MILHNIKIIRYQSSDIGVLTKTFDFSDSKAKENKVVINGGSFDGDLRVQVLSNGSQSGAKIGRPFGNPRLFTLKGQIFGKDRLTLSEGQDLLREALGLGVNRGDSKFTITFSLDNFTGTNLYTSEVQVYKLPAFTMSSNDLVQNFTFELISEDFEYSNNSSTDINNSGAGGLEFLTNVESPSTGLSTFRATFTCSNATENIKVQNWSTGDFYQINTNVGAGEEVIFDFLEGKDPIITVGGVTKRIYRAPGSTSLFLTTGWNKIKIFSDIDMGNVNLDIRFYEKYV